MFEFLKRTTDYHFVSLEGTFIVSP